MTPHTICDSTICVHLCSLKVLGCDYTYYFCSCVSLKVVLRLQMRCDPTYYVRAAHFIVTLHTTCAAAYYVETVFIASHWNVASHIINAAAYSVEMVLELSN